MSSIRPCPAKNNAELAREWDQLAEERHRQISSGEDVSFDHVVVPTSRHLLLGADLSVVLDVGCGTGEFTGQLAATAGTVIAIDPSTANMALTRSVCRGAKNVRFFEASVEEVANSVSGETATAAVAVMTLMTAPNLRDFANAVGELLKPGGQFVATLTHPCFWPRYWDYEKEPWFRYECETFIEAPFVISRRQTELRTTHIHRPLNLYLNTFAQQGFRLNAMAEPMPDPSIQSLYPRPWEFPRFLGLRWEKIG